MNSKVNKKIISVNPSFEGAISFAGLILLVLGLVGFLYFKEMNFIPLIPIGLFLFLNLKGTEINPEKKMVRKFNYYILFRAGKWTSVSNFNAIVLNYTNQSQTMLSRGFEQTIRTNSFSVYLMNDQKNKLELDEFTNYEKAKEFLEIYSKKLNLKAIDVIKNTGLLSEHLKQKRKNR